MRIIRARDMRSFGRRGTGVKVFVRLIGILFLRTVDRAERIYYAMLSRGFQGDIPSLKRSRIVLPDLAFLAMMIAYLWVFPLLPHHRRDRSRCAGAGCDEPSYC